MQVTTTDLVRLEDEDGIRTIRFDRPDALNAANAELVDGFNEALSKVNESPGRGLLLTGNGRATQAGLDREMAEAGYPDAFPEVAATIEENQRLQRAYPAPMVMAGRGAVVGLGFGMAMRCDLLVLGEETHFSYPEITYDIPPGSLPDIQAAVGSRIAKEIVLTGEPVAPERAYELGLANRVVPEDEVEETARELLAHVAGFDPEIVRDVLATSSALLPEA